MLHVIKEYNLNVLCLQCSYALSAHILSNPGNETCSSICLWFPWENLLLQACRIINTRKVHWYNKSSEHRKLGQAHHPCTGSCQEKQRIVFTLLDLCSTILGISQMEESYENLFYLELHDDLICSGNLTSITLILHRKWLLQMRTWCLSLLLR